MGWIMNTRTIAKIVLSPLCAFVFTSCATVQGKYQENPKAVLGAVLGAAAGAGIAAAAGGNTGAIVASAVGGGLVGGIVGKKLDDRDKRMATEAAARAFEDSRTGESTTWTNPDSGNSGTVTPTRTYQLANGQYCRQYQQKIVIGGEENQTYGTACRQTDGTWQTRS